jgi:hypothetical protein
LLAARKVAEALPKDSQLPPDFETLEPPAVRIDKADKEVGPNGVKLTLIATPRSDNVDHAPQRVDLWVNDFRLETWEPDGQPFHKEIVVPREAFRTGKNELTLQSFNRLGGRAEATAAFVHKPAAAEKPRLFGLSIGVNDYSKVGQAPGGKRLFGNLTSAVRDAEAMQQSWLKQKDKLYGEVKIELTRDRDVNRAALAKQLAALKGQVRPDDLLVLFLAGHGDLHQDKENSTFVFCFTDYDRKRYNETGMTSGDLYEALAALPCRKLVFLDACRSGDMAINPIRNLTPAGKGPTIFAACDRSQPSFEHGKFGHGLFTYAVVEAMDKSFARADRNSDGQLDAAELFAFVQMRVSELLKDIERDDEQHPIHFPRVLEPFPLAGK